MPISDACKEAGKRYQWTPERARAASLKGHQDAKAQKDRIAEAVRVALEAAKRSDFASIRLAKLQKDIATADEKSRTCNDPVKALAWAKLAAELQEQERILAGRPLPGRKDAKRPDAPRPPAVPLPDEPDQAPGP